MSSRPARDLFLISFLILFLELACIRYFGSTVVFLTFFTNIVLMACFLGMTVGCLAASRKQNFINMALPLLLVAVGFAALILWAYTTYGQIMIDVGGQNSPQQIYFGTEYRPHDPTHFVLPLEILAGIFYVLIALAFVGFGQVMGRAFRLIPNPVVAYSFNILGSLCGIATFSLVSFLKMGPLAWFVVVLLISFIFVKRWIFFQIATAAAILAVVFFSAMAQKPDEKVFWSPYYKIQYHPASGEINTNNIAHQQMMQINQEGPAYSLPHLLNRDSGGAPFKDVMVIGAGSGNDVEAALSFGANHVDAVEIDPVINGIGRKNHPDHPYDDPRVTIHLDDGRSFTRKTTQTYDLAIYALVDSLVLHSGYSSIRLESFLFTEEAFRDIKKLLKPGGLFAMYNYYRQGWVVARLAKMAEKVFGAPPLVISLPYQETISPTDNQANYITFLIAGDPASETFQNLKKKIGREGSPFWVNEKPSFNRDLNGFSPQPPETQGASASSWKKIAPAMVKSGDELLPHDNWPFLYLKDRVIPNLNLKGMAVIAFLSLGILFAFAPMRNIRPNGQMFFLGAGFMLLETKGVVHMALLFGSTWIVNSVVFFAILLMTLMSNLYVLRFKPKSLIPFYVLLMAALLGNALIPMKYFLALPGLAKILISCGIIFLPIFFAGVIFATLFGASRQPDVDFGSNIGGVILGGLSEYLSLMIGFNGLIFLAMAYYLLSILIRPRRASFTFSMNP